jgi:hypothetical protein
MPTNQLLSLSSANLKRAAAIQARIEQLQAQLARLIGASDAASPVAARTGRRGPISEARRKRLSQIAKARWKKAKAAGKRRL